VSPPLLSCGASGPGCTSQSSSSCPAPSPETTGGPKRLPPGRELLQPLLLPFTYQDACRNLTVHQWPSQTCLQSVESLPGPLHTLCL
jgi:hypothetical protein